MHINERVAVFKRALVLLGLSFTAGAMGQPIFQKDAQGLVRPFKVKQMPLAQFTREFAAFRGIPVYVGGRWEEELQGKVTLFMSRPMKLETLDEVFHQVLEDKSYAVVDAPDKSGWLIERTRDARDAVIPVYDAAQVPSTYRMVTASYHLRVQDAETVARTMRSFMPANSRIIPVSSAQVFITDSGKNIAKLVKLIELLDTENQGRADKNATKSTKPVRTCRDREQKIGKLTVENLEIRGMEGAPAPVQAPKKRGGK